MDSNAQSEVRPHEPAAAAKPRRAWIRRSIYLALTGVLVFFVARAMNARIAGIDWATLRLNVPLLIAGTLCLALHELLSGLTLMLSLRTFGQPVGPRVSIAAYWVAALAKYIPGKVGTVAAAVAVLQRAGVRISVGVGATLMHLGLTVLVGLMMAAPLLLASRGGEGVPAGWIWCCVLLVSAMICLHPKVFVALANFVLRKTGREPITQQPRNGYLAATAILTAGRLCVLGAGVWLIARSLLPVSAGDLWLFISTAVAATVLGFLAFFAPAGLGVREGIYAELLLGAMGGGPAALLALLVRLCQVLIDVAVALGALVMLRQSRSDRQ